MHLPSQLAGLLSLFIPSFGSTSADLQSCLVSAVGGDKSRAAFAGKLFYDLVDVKWYNLYFPVIPAAIIYPQSSQEVSLAVECASQAGAKVQARSGGHSYANYCLGGVDGAVVIDLKNFNQIIYDSQTKTASIGPGCRLADVDAALVQNGRVVPHGTAPQVGVGGHFTVGGLGPLSRQFGAATDQIISVEVVLANGSIVTASPQENPDLLFALQGSGASFGVVTNLVVQTHAMPSSAVQFTYNVTIGDVSAQAAAFKAYQALISQPDLSRNLSTLFSVYPGGVAVTGTYFGLPADFDELKLDTYFPGAGSSGGNNGTHKFEISLVSSAVGVVGEALLRSALDVGGNIPAHFYSKSLAITNDTLLPDAAVDAMFAAINSGGADASADALVWFTLFDLQAGAINDRPADATAFPFRDVLYYFQSYVIDPLGFQQGEAKSFLDGVVNTIRAQVPAIQGAYPGYVDPYLGNAQQMYWQGNLPRLQGLKAVWDPTNVFSNPQSVQAAT